MNPVISQNPQNTIQGFGALVCLDAELRHVQQVSANIEDILGLPVEECVGALAARVLGKSLVGRLRRTMRSADKTRGALAASRGKGTQRRNLNVNAYRSDNSIVVELEPLGPASGRRWLSRVNEWLEHIVSTQTQDELLDTLARSIHALTAYDQVLVHSFDADWNSTVLAECQTDDTWSYLGYRFLASHISPETRAAYQYNRVRMIADVAAEAVPLVPPAEGAMDLRPGILRASSPTKMGNLMAAHVGASFTIAIAGEDGLWGRVVCHSWHPRTLEPSARDAAATLTQVAAQRLFLLNAQANARYRQEVQENRVLLDEGIQQRAAPGDLLREYADQWLHLFEASGLALVYRDLITSEGQAPVREDIRALADWLETKVTAPVPWVTKSLADEGFHFTADTACCGLLAMPLVIDMTARGWVLLFRRESRETTDWAGLPADVPPGAQNVRQWESFVTWQQEVRGQSAPWHPAELIAVQDLGEDLAVIAAAHEIVALNKRLQKKQQALSEANQHLKQLAETDGLTGAANRARMEALIDDALDVAQRYQQTFSLLLLDIDHFKSINDTYGHNVGDQVLKGLVRHAGGCLRQTDYLGRWGGEEFILLLRNTAEDQARALAERLCELIRGTRFDSLDRPVTVSIGVAEWREGDSRKALVGRADNVLYQAKKSGRDRVVVAG